MNRPLVKLAQDHNDILEIIHIMVEKLPCASEEQGAALLFQKLAELQAILEEHLSIEDQSIYQVLRQSNEEHIRNLANSFSNQFGGIKKSFITYVEHWNSPEAIKEVPNDFINETKALAEVLRLRIRKENSELFPLL